MSQLLESIGNLVTPLFEKANVELVDLEYIKEPGGWVLRFFLDKPGGFGLSDCEHWSHQLDAVLDQSNLISRSYNLEISSPGLERPLKKTADFQKFSGQRVHVKLFAPINNQRNFHGVLLGADEEKIRLKSDEGQEVELPRTMVAKTKLNPVINF